VQTTAGFALLPLIGVVAVATTTPGATGDG